MDILGSIIVWAIFGLIVGAIARLIFPGAQPMGILATMVLGIIGSMVGGFVSWIFTGGPAEPYAPAGWIMSIIGAIVVVWIYIAATRPRTTP